MNYKPNGHHINCDLDGSISASVWCDKNCNPRKDRYTGKERKLSADEYWKQEEIKRTKNPNVWHLYGVY